VTRRPAFVSQELTADTVAVVVPKRWKYWLGVRKWRYSALPAVETASANCLRLFMPPFGAR
jgi:hypothetical protein